MVNLFGDIIFVSLFEKRILKDKLYALFAGYIYLENVAAALFLEFESLEERRTMK